MVTLTDDTEVERVLSEFNSNGYVRLGVALGDDDLNQLRVRCDDLMLGRVRYPSLFFQHDSPSGKYADLEFGRGWVGPSNNYRKLEGLQVDPLFMALIQHRAIEPFARHALGHAISLYRAVLWNKAPNAGTELPWHQDDGKFWGIDRRPFFQVWVALDDCPEASGCLEIVPDTHLAGLASAEGGTVQPDALEAAKAEHRLVKLPARAGEIILIHNHLWHRSGCNQTDRPRRAISISYLDAETKCMRRRRAPREFARVFENAEQANDRLSKVSL